MDTGKSCSRVSGTYLPQRPQQPQRRVQRVHPDVIVARLLELLRYAVQLWTQHLVQLITGVTPPPPHLSTYPSAQK